MAVHLSVSAVRTTTLGAAAVAATLLATTATLDTGHVYRLELIITLGLLLEVGGVAHYKVRAARRLAGDISLMEEETVFLAQWAWAVIAAGVTGLVVAGSALASGYTQALVLVLSAAAIGAGLIARALVLPAAMEHRLAVEIRTVEEEMWRRSDA